MEEKFVTINISCKEHHIADFLRQMANVVESDVENEEKVQEEEFSATPTFRFQNEDGHIEIMCH